MSSYRWWVGWEVVRLRRAGGGWVRQVCWGRGSKVLVGGREWWELAGVSTLKNRQVRWITAPFVFSFLIPFSFPSYSQFTFSVLSICFVFCSLYSIFFSIIFLYTVLPLLFSPCISFAILFMFFTVLYLLLAKFALSFLFLRFSFYNSLSLLLYSFFFLSSQFSCSLFPPLFTTFFCFRSCFFFSYMQPITSVGYLVGRFLRS